VTSIVFLTWNTRLVLFSKPRSLHVIPFLILCSSHLLSLMWSSLDPLTQISCTVRFKFSFYFRTYMRYLLYSQYIHRFILFVYTDVMGQVVDRSEIQDLNANNKPTKKSISIWEISSTNNIYSYSFLFRYLLFIYFLLINLFFPFKWHRLACTLWGKYAEIVDQACQESTDSIVVCLIRFAKINLYNGNYIVMCYYISILFKNTTLYF